MADANGWCTIESDPAVFTEMLEKVGCKGVAAEEIISLDPGTLASLTNPVLGLVLLFKWKKQTQTRNVMEDANLYFAQQVVSNACATQAIVNIVLNHDSADGVDVGPELKNFKEFTKDLPPRTRGEMIGQCEALRSVHNGFARSTAFSFEDKQSKEDDDCYHFISYLYKDGSVWELDGLQPGPIFIEPATTETWVETAAQAIRARMEEISALDKTGKGQGLSFSLMALTGDKVAQLKAKLAANRNDAVTAAALADAEALRAAGVAENVRRRHNYVPVVVSLFKALAEKGQLRGIVDAALAKQAAEKASKAGAK